MSDTTTRMFDLGDVLTVSDGRLVSPRMMEGVYEILAFMTGQAVFTHQIPRAMRECKPALLAQHPQLADVDRETKLGPENVVAWLAAQKRIYGESLPVAPLASFTRIDPTTELELLIGKERVVAIQTDVEG